MNRRHSERTWRFTDQAGRKGEAGGLPMRRRSISVTRSFAVSRFGNSFPLSPQPSNAAYVGDRGFERRSVMRPRSVTQSVPGVRGTKRVFLQHRAILHLTGQGAVLEDLNGQWGNPGWVDLEGVGELPILNLDPFRQVRCPAQKCHSAEQGVLADIAAVELRTCGRHRRRGVRHSCTARQGKAPSVNAAVFILWTWSLRGFAANSTSDRRLNVKTKALVVPCVGSGGGRLPAAPKAGRHGDRVPGHLHHPLFDKEGEGGFSVAGRHVILEIERRHELAEHCGLADRL